MARGRALALLLALWPAFAWSAAPRAPDGPAQAVFASVKDSVLQIRTLLKGSQSQNSTGSGFHVSDDGLVITNYHVVASHALEPESYDIEFVSSRGERGALTLLAVDVLHDLALLRRQGSRLPYLKFPDKVAARGEKLYSLGNPNDLGMVIVEGVNNGEREHAFYDSLHFTGAINPGMSGGPVVNRGAGVTGINVATMGESRGFLVPSHHARALLANWRADPAPVSDLVPEITRQMKLHSAALAQRLASRPLPVQPDAGYAVPDAADPYMRCWASKSDNLKLFYDVRSYSCSGDSSVYVGQGVSVGEVQFESRLFQSDKLDAVRFAYLVQQAYGGSDGYSSDIKHYGKFACTDAVLQLDGMAVKTALCLRPYRKFTGLYDFQLNVASLRESHRALVTRLSLHGMTHEDGMRMVRRYLEAQRWRE